MSSQVRVSVKPTGGQDEELLVLLSRHIKNTRETSDFIALKVQLEDDEVDVLDSEHADVHAISARVRTSITILVNHSWRSQGNYTNSPHVLVKVLMSDDINILTFERPGFAY